MAGITKIRIISSWNDWRTEMEEGPLSQVANGIYREAFSGIGMPIADGYEEVECSKQEAAARYDWKEGIDVIFEFESGTRATAQEKFLTYYKSTATFEETKTSGDRGAWYYCTAQYYFVGYAREWKIYKQPERKWPKKPIFHDWILIDFPAIRRASAMNQVPWHFNNNKHDGRRARFRYAYFDNIPKHCIVDRYKAQRAFAF